LEKTKNDASQQFSYLGEYFTKVLTWENPEDGDESQKKSNAHFSIKSMK